MYDCLLLPTDGSPEMVGVIEHAVALAEAHDAQVRALYVVDTATLSRLPMEASFETVAELLEEEGEQATAMVEDVADGRVPVEGVVLDGSPAREIVREADDGDCDVIVMGTHARGGIDRLLLGSVAERVIRAAPVPVLTVRVEATPSTDPEDHIEA